MKANFNLYNTINSYSETKGLKVNQPQITFGSAKTKKFLENIKSAKNLKHIEATFEEVAAAYKELGFDIVFKRGSHAIIPLTDKLNLPLVIPHGKKYVHYLDLKRLQYVLNGETEKALNVH